MWVVFNSGNIWNCWSFSWPNLGQKKNWQNTRDIQGWYLIYNLKTVGSEIVFNQTGTKMFECWPKTIHSKYQVHFTVFSVIIFFFFLQWFVSYSSWNLLILLWSWPCSGSTQVLHGWRYLQYNNQKEKPYPCFVFWDQAVNAEYYSNLFCQLKEKL